MDILNTFAELKFRLDSSSLTLSNTACTHAFSGPGEVWQDPKGKIFFKLYLNDNARALSEYCRKTIRIGYIRKQSDYFDLSVHGEDGRTWSATQVWPTSRKELGGDKALISGQLRELKCIHSSPNAAINLVEMHFRGLLNYPSNITHETSVSLDGRLIRRQFDDGAALVKVKDCEIRFFQNKSHTVAQIKSTSELPSNVSSQIKNALQYCLASPIDCIVIKSFLAKNLSIEISLRESLNETSFIAGSYLPIDLEPDPPMDYGSDFWRLFSNYLSNSFTSSAKDDAALSELVYAIISSRRVSLRSETLSLCIGVEGIGRLSMNTLKSFISGYKDVQQHASATNSQIELAMNIIDNDANLDRKIKDRIISALKGWTNESPMEVVDAFIRSQNLPARLMKSWKSLRHPGAHGSTSNSEPIDLRIQRLNDVRFLFHLLVMAMIGYNGPCIDYSNEGWPAYSLETWPAM